MNTQHSDDVRIARTHPLLTPALLFEEQPCTNDSAHVVRDSRKTIENIFNGVDNRTLVVVGPCSIHDVESAREYAHKLKPIADALSDKLFVVMRVYFEKPRTVVGWKGLINDPDIDGSYQINKGLRLARRLLIDVANIGLPAGTEFLETTLGQFYADLVSWGAIGARTAESQVHRELASGLSMPVGIKNRTDGDVQVAVDAIQSARHRHLFPSLTKEGAPAILETTGNPSCHLILRGGSNSGPNYDASHVQLAKESLAAANLSQTLMIDCSHGNSNKDPQRQKDVVDSIMQQAKQGERAIKALMIESHLQAGRQDANASSLEYGKSITDACLSFDETVELLQRLASSENGFDT